MVAQVTSVWRVAQGGWIDVTAQGSWGAVVVQAVGESLVLQELRASWSGVAGHIWCRLSRSWCG